MSCYECGRACVVNDDGTANHVDEEGTVDHDTDAIHVAIPESELCDRCGLETDDPEEHQANCPPDEEA